MTYLTLTRNGVRAVVHGTIPSFGGTLYRVKIIGTGKWSLWKPSECRVAVSEKHMQRKRKALTP